MVGEVGYGGFKRWGGEQPGEEALQGRARFGRSSGPWLAARAFGREVGVGFDAGPGRGRRRF